MYQISGQYHKKQERKVRKTKFLLKAITQTWQKSNLICMMSRQIHIPNFKSISERTTEKSSENRVDGHRVDWLTDGQTDGEETWSPPGFTGRGLRKICISNVWLLLGNQKHRQLYMGLRLDWLISFYRFDFHECLLKTLEIYYER